MRSEVHYGFTRTLPGVSVDDAIDRITTALGAEGFGVLSDIDVQATLKAKLSVDVAPYRILGACNPTLAHEGLDKEPMLGLLLPCNVVVTQDERGDAVVAAVRPERMLAVVDSPELARLADEASSRLQRALAAA